MSAIFFRTAIVFVLLTVSMKLMGKREIGELEVGELISALLISEICSIPIGDTNVPILNAVIPVILLVSLEIILSFVKNKSRALKRVVDGSSVFLIKNHKLMQTELIANRISLEEFFAALRQNGTGCLSDVKHCILEANGEISVIRDTDTTDALLIVDGEVNEKALAENKISRNKLEKKLGGRQAREVFLMTLSEDGSYNIILKEEKQ